MPKGKARTRTQVERTFHEQERRTNIPTSELGSFMKEEQKAPQKVLYPRDPSLDPQLVWKGKDEQDSAALEVDAVPIYIQEKIEPKALIEELRAEQEKIEPQASLFADFNGITFEQMVDFYQHPQNWSNRLILGDSLRVMTSLAEKEGLKGQVQVVYMDPPYGIKFGSNWQVSTRSNEIRDGRDLDLTRQPEQVKAFRDTWALGVHSYLSYLRDRLVVANSLLSQTGSIFVQIGPDRVHLVRAVLDEIFGSDNCMTTITVQKTSQVTARYLPEVSDFLLWYAKDKESVKYRQLYENRADELAGEGAYRHVEISGQRRPMTAEEIAEPSRLPQGARVFRYDNVTSQGFSNTKTVPFEFEGRTFHPGANRHWLLRPQGMDGLAKAHRLAVVGNTLSYVRYADESSFVRRTNIWTDTGQAGFAQRKKEYVVETNAKIPERCILMSSDPGDLILDPTCGSGTTAVSAEKHGRRWITIDTSRVALALARARMMAAAYRYYELADPTAGVRAGFRYDTFSWVRASEIGYGEGESQEIPLYDQSRVVPGVLRVTGPLTVESLSPHITLSTEGERSTADEGVAAADGVGGFHRLVLDHLRKAGVQNTVRSERLVFETLEPWAGTYIHAVGEYRESGYVKRAAVSIGPEFGTVDVDYVREAAKEASVFVDLLIVCGFAFDGYIAGEFKQLGNLTILKAAMNPDLAMGDELLKKTGSANLFTVFGEPDIDVRQEGDGQWVVEVRGIDVYDPTTGEIRSHSTDDIACWFIDTDYDRASFFVRHAYFLGGNDPYDQLKRALRADIDETVWASLYSTTSRPFPKPKRGQIAVKVINHYGDEVMKVYPIT